MNFPLCNGVKCCGLSQAGWPLSVLSQALALMWNPISNVHRWTLTRLFFSENVSFVSDLLKLSKRRNDTASFRNKSEQLLSAEAESPSISSLPPSLSVSHWLTETNNRIWGCEDSKVLKQHKDCLQACHKGMVESEVFSSSRHKIYPSTSYRIHNHIVEPNPQVLDADHDLLA